MPKSERRRVNDEGLEGTRSFFGYSGFVISASFVIGILDFVIAIRDSSLALALVLVLQDAIELAVDLVHPAPELQHRRLENSDSIRVVTHVFEFADNDAEHGAHQWPR